MVYRPVLGESRCGGSKAQELFPRQTNLARCTSYTPTNFSIMYKICDKWTLGNQHSWGRAAFNGTTADSRGRPPRSRESGVASLT